MRTLDTQKLGYPPGPAPVGANLLAQLRFGLHVTRDPLTVMSGWFQQYGDIVHLQFGDSAHAFLLAHPEHIHEVLVEKADYFHKAGSYKDEKRGLTRILGHGLVTSDGDYWRRQRKLMQPAFHSRRIEAYADTMVQKTLDMMQNWQNKATLALSEEMTRLTLSIVAKTILDTDVADEAELIAQTVTVFQKLAFGVDIFPLWFPTPTHLQQRLVEKRMNKIVHHLIEERRKDLADRGDLLSMLLLASDEDGQGMSDTQIRDEVVTLFLAGHETTATALTWIWYLLAKHPEIEQQLHEQLDNVLQGQPPKLADLKQLPLTEQIVKEAMRLYPPIWNMSRQAIADVEIAGYRIPKGSEVTIVSYVMHHDPRWWDEAECFMPQRFSPEKEKQIPKMTYLPFSTGPRVCLGNHFAMMEAQLILATMAGRYQLSLPNGYVAAMQPLIALRPRNDLEMMLQAR
jgi:cytochrome P450